MVAALTAFKILAKVPVRSNLSCNIPAESRATRKLRSVADIRPTHSSKASFREGKASARISPGNALRLISGLSATQKQFCRASPTEEIYEMGSSLLNH
jgi:hypothetical protein